jgi:signal transduction histidine kinase
MTTQPGTDSAPHSPDSLEQLIRLEQVRMIYHQLHVSVSGTMVGVLVVVTMMWPAVPHWLLLAWLLCMSANQAWRLMLYIRFRRRGIDLANRARWERYWVAGSALSGLIWGAAGILFFVPESPLHQALLISSIFAITAVAVPLLATHAPSFYAFIFPVLLATIGRSAWEGDTLHLLLAFMATAVMVGTLAVGRKYHALLTGSLRARFENEMLAARLQEKNIELERAQSISEQASRAKAQFFAAANHDLRQPLHAMGLFAAALAEKAHDPEVAKVVSSIGESVDALESLFNELLDLSKIDSGAIQPNLCDFALRPLLGRLQMNMQPDAFEKGLQLRLRSREVFVRTDPILLERILGNLISNAIRYTSSGGILVGLRRRGKNLSIEVWDSGPGIPEDQHGRIFEEFYQIGNPARDRRKGLGLGLSIVKRLSQLLDLPLFMRSRPGRGTMFRIDVPLAPAAAPVVEAEARPVLKSGFSGKKILVIDDEAAVRDGMAALLESWGAQAITCATLEETAQAASALPHAPDLIVADYNLREGALGSAAIQLVRRHFAQEIPSIMVTGSTTPERILEARAIGYHFLLKPVMPAKLRTLINFMLHEEN